MHYFHPPGVSVPPAIMDTLSRQSEYAKDADTGRSDISAKYGIISVKRKPDGSTFDYPLENWNARLIAGTQISVERQLHRRRQRD